MKSLTIKSISLQPVKKEIKAPFVASALVCGDVVGFCLSDFCSQIVEHYKKNQLTKFSPEFIFSRLVLMLSTSKYRHHGRKISLELLTLMNFPYRPWYICDKDQKVIGLLSDAGIDLSSDAYSAFPKIVKGGIQHPYLAIVLNQHLNTKSGIKSFYDLDAFTLVKNIRYLINNKSFYRTCVQSGYFKRDEVLLQLFEYLVEALDGHRFSNYANAVDHFAKDLHYVLGRKSQLLILKCYALSSHSPCFKSSIHEFERSKNYSTKNDYKVPFYRSVASSAIAEDNWALFETSLEVLKTVLGESDPTVKSLLSGAEIKRKSKQEVIGYQAEVVKGLAIERAIRSVSFVREVDYYRSYHLFSPTYYHQISIAEVSTQCLINLMVLLASLDTYRIQRDVFDRVAIRSMYSDDSVVWMALSDLIGSKVIKLDCKTFEGIPVKALNNIESYFGMSFSLNLEEIQARGGGVLEKIENVINARADRQSAVCDVWRKYAESHFYAAIDDCSSRSNYKIDLNRDIYNQFKSNFRKSELSASTLRLVVYQAITHSVTSMANTKGLKRTSVKNTISLNLTRYLNEATQGGFSGIPDVSKTLNTPTVERILTLLTGLKGHELYNCKPNVNLLLK